MYIQVDIDTDCVFEQMDDSDILAELQGRDVDLFENADSEALIDAVVNRDLEIEVIDDFLQNNYAPIETILDMIDDAYGKFHNGYTPKRLA